MYKYELNFPIKCMICNKIIKSKSGLGVHVKNQHKKLTYKEYLKKYYNIDLDKLEKEWFSKKDERKKKSLSGLSKHIQTKGKLSPKKRMTKKQYNSWRESMKGVFTKKWYIKKYGKEKGIEKYNERSLNLSKNNSFRKYNIKNKQNFSKISQELFWGIYNNINFSKVYFGELNHEYGCETNKNFDFVVVDNKKIIEFNGDKWHANPILYEENDYPCPFHKNKKAKQIWKEDIIKQNKAIRKGYSILIVWESDYYNNKKEILNKCLNFLES